MAEAEASTIANQQRAQKMAFDMQQDVRQERQQRRNARAKQEQDAAERLASIDVAKAEFGLATAPQTITDSERNRLEGDFTATRSQIAAEAAAALAADTLADPVANETEGGFLGFGAEPTAAALEKQKAAERFQDPANLTDDDLETYRAKNPASFAKFDELRTKLDTDQKARDARSSAEFGVALAKARKSGFDPLAGSQPNEDPVAALDRVQGEVETMQPRIAELQTKARSGLPLGELQPVLEELGTLQSDFTRKTQFLETGRAAIDAQRRASQVSQQSTRENAVKGPTIPQVSPETAKTAALTLPDGSYETTQPENLAALVKDGAKVFWKQDGAASTATPETRAAKIAEAAQTITDVKTAAQEVTARTAAERDRLQGLVDSGAMTPEHANAALEALIDNDDAQGEAAAAVVNRKLDSSVRDFMDGQIDAGTLDSILHAAGSPSSAAEVAAEATKQRKVEDEHVTALKTKIEGDPNDPVLSGEALKLSKKVRDIENPSFLRKWGKWLMASPITASLGAIVDAVDTVDWLLDPSLWGKEEAEKASILKTRLAELRQQSKDTLAKELTGRGVDLADQPRLIARAQLEAERDSGIMEVAASRGGVAQAVGEKLPFVGAILEADRLLPFAETAYKLQAGEQVEADEMEAFSEFIRFAGNDQAFFTKVTDTIASLPAYVVELASTSGIASAVRTGGTKVLKEAIMAAATKEGKERLVKASAEAVAKKFGKDHAKKYAAWRIGSGLAQEAVRLPVASGARIAAGFNRDAAMDGVQLTPGEQGIVAMMDREGRKGNWERFAASSVDSLIENVSERSGGYLAKLIPAGVRQSVAKMSQQAKGKLLSAALVKSLVAANPNKPVGQIGKFLKGANIGGTFEEMGEERVGALLRDIYKGTTTGEWELTIPTAEDLAVEIVAFTVPGAARGIQTNRHFSKLDNSLRASDSEFTARLDSLYQSPEAEADRITEKIGAPVEADDLTNATSLVGNFEKADAVKAVDRLSLDLMERSEKALAGGDLEKASRLRQRALQVNRSKGDLLDIEIVRAVGASKEISGLRDFATQTRAQVEAMPDADPGKKQALVQVEKMEREADLAGALVKIAQGREGVLTAAEQEAIKPVKGTKPAVVIENGSTIITDSGIATLRNIAPTAATFVKDDETTRRQKLLSQSTPAQQPPASSPAAGVPVVGGSSPQAGAAPTASSGAGVAQGAATAPPAVAAPVNFQSVPAGKGTVSVDPDGSIRVKWNNNDVDPAALIQEATANGLIATISGTSGSGGSTTSEMVFARGSTSTPAQTPAAQGQPAKPAPAPKPSQSSPTSSNPATAPAADKPKTAKEWRNDTRKRVVDKIRDPKTKAKIARVVDAVGDALEKRGNPPPGGVVLGEQKGGSGVSYNPDTKAIEINVRLLNSQVHDEKAGALNDEQLADWMDRIASEEMTHFATVEAISPAEAAAAWKKLGKSKAGRKLQDDALRAYNASYEQAGKAAPKLGDASAYYELVRMAIQKTEFRQRITEAAFAEPGIKADLLAFLQRIADILTQRIAALPKAARAALEGDLAKVKAAMDALGIVTDSGKQAPAAVVVGPQQSSDTGKPAADPGQAAAGNSALVVVQLKDGRAFHVRKKELDATGDTVRAFTWDGKPIKGDAGAIPRSEILTGTAPTTPVDAAANEAATSPANDKPQPTDAQKKAGNYEMGHVTIGGMDITIENPAGSIRSGKDKDGETWQVTMASHYGYIKGTEGKDGDHIDIFIEEGTPEDYSGPVYVVNQMRPVNLTVQPLGGGAASNVNAGMEFDEHKVVMGPSITSAQKAREAYLANYSPGWNGAGSIAVFRSVQAFKEWATARQRRAPAKPVNPPQSNAPAPESTGVADAPKVDTPAFKSGDRVTWTSGNEELSGIIRSVSSDGTTSINTDQIAFVGGVPIGRIETVQTSRLKMWEEEKPANTPPEMLTPAEFNKSNWASTHLKYMMGAVAADKPINATAVKEYGVNPPEGWTQVGDTYMPPKPAPKVKAPKKDTPRPADVSKPAVSEAEQIAADAMRANLKGLFSAPRSVPAGESADDPAVMALQTLSEVDELFRYPVLPNVSSLTEIMRQVFPGSRYLGDATRPDEKDESTADKRRMFATPNGKEFYVYDRGDEVWIDVSRLEEGDRGSAIYAAVGNYAFNAGKTFIGDPAGLSEAAIIRRTSHMISLALRYGTTRHIEPAKEQLAGMPEKGIAPLQMTGNYDQQVRGLIDSFLATSRNLYPEATNATYDFDTGVFKDAKGRVYTPGANLDERGTGVGELPQPRGQEDRQGNSGRTGPGEATDRRRVFLQSLVSATGEEQSRLLENFRRWGSAYVRDGGLTGIFSAPRPAAEWRDEDIPEDRIEGIMQTAKLVVNAGVRTPEDFAAFMERTFPGGGSRPYVSGIWQILGGMRKELRTATIPDWQGIYAGIDGTQDDSAENTGIDPLLANNPGWQSATSTPQTKAIVNRAIELGAEFVFSESPLKANRDLSLGINEATLQSMISPDVAPRAQQAKAKSGKQYIIIYPAGLADENLAVSLRHEVIHLAQDLFHQTDEGIRLLAGSMQLLEGPGFQKELDDQMRLEYPVWDSLSNIEKVVETTRAIIEGMEDGKVSGFTGPFRQYLNGFINYVQKLLGFDSWMRRYTQHVIDILNGGEVKVLKNLPALTAKPQIDGTAEMGDSSTNETQPPDGADNPPQVPEYAGRPDGAADGYGNGDASEEGAGSGSAPSGKRPGKRGATSGVGVSDDGRSDSGNQDESIEQDNPVSGGSGTTGADGADSERGGAGEGLVEPERRPGRPNYYLSDPESIVGGGPKARFNKNKRALEVLEAVQSEGRDPTDAELDILAAYTGWGALAQELFQGGSFDRHAGPEEWKEESMWLREHLGRDAWMSAFDSILNAHYTDPPSITAMWDIVRRLGFNGGRVLEPSEAIGTFWSLMPRDLMDRSQLTGIEMDPTTAAIARMLHPRVNHRTMPYQQSQTSDNFYDLAIGNWPFSATDKPADTRFDHLQAPVHDYFFLKTLSQVRPGGLVIGITSSSTMDKKNSRVRKYLAARGELVSAFRLPTGAFGKYAGTKVVVDLIIIKKREQELTEDASGQGWIESVKDPQGRDFNINEYYVANPQNILGDLDFGHGTTFNRAGMIVNRRPDYDQVLPQLFNWVPENVMTPWNPIGRERIIQNTTSERRQGAVVESGDSLYVVDGESLVPLQDKAKWEIKDAKKQAKRKLEALALIKMRSALTDLLDSYRRNESGDTQREALKASYEAFTKEHGKLNDSFMLDRFRKAGDQDAINILALVDYDHNTKTEKPRALLLRNTMRRNELDAKGSIADAYALHRSETLDFDPVKVAALAGPEVTSDQVIDFLKERNLVYKLPDGRWLPGELYLAGNVRQKLREAIAAKEEGVEGMEPGIESLRAIVPADVPYHQITVQMGAAWIAPTDYQDFIKETLGGRDEDIQVVKALSGYNVRISNQTADSADARNTWNVVDEVGRSRLHPSRIFQAAMNGTELTIKDTIRDDNGTREVLNEALTRRAMELRDRIRNQFELWLWRDEGRIARLQANYNELKNSVVNPSHDGSHLRLPGLALTIGNKGDAFEFRQHQLNAVWRGILTQQGVYAHEVGTGKTFTMAGLAIEGRRLGSHRKPIIFAHNANAASVAADFRLAYPGAKVLFVDNLSPSTKELTLRQIATDEWDAIIVPHSLVDRFGLKPESVRALAQPQLDRIEAEFWEEIDDLGLDASQIDLDNPRGLAGVLNRAKGSSTAKDLANQRRRIMTRIDQQIAKFSGPGTVFFEDMGIDAVIVDEAHVFKKIALATRKTIKGLNKDESGKGFQLGLLTDWLKTQTGGKGVHLFTGTPVTNTLNEVFNMMRFAMDKEMSEAGVDSFDDFYNDYAAGYSDTEPTSGGTYEEVLRLRGFNNIPELARMASQAFDVVRADEMPEFTPRDSREGLTENPIGRPHKQIRPVVIQPTAVATRLKTWIRQRFFYYRGLDARSRMFLKRAGGDQPVMMDADGKAGALDPRLVSMTAEDDPNSKLNFAVRNIMEHYNEHENATQMVFVERGAGDYTEAEVAVRDGDGMPIYNNDGVKLTQKERRAQFNLLRDMVEKLVAQGVKPEEIAVFHNMALLPLADGRDDVLLKVRRVKDADDKEEIAKEMREGKIRIAFGGTETMGTGVNAQTWMRAMHHLDVPYMPGELEQRNGRGWRQGNKWNTVFEYRYTVEGSHDAKMWSTLLNKVKFIERFIGMLQGKNLVRSLEGEGADAAEDADGISMADFEQMFSTAAGDPRLILRSSLSKKVDRLRQGRSVHLQFLEQTRRKVESLENREIPNMEASIATLDRGTELFGELAGKPFQITLRDQEYTERKDFDEAMKRLPRYTDRKQIGQYGPFAIWVRPGIGTEFYELTAAGGFKVEFASPSIASLEGTLRAMKKRSENVKAQMEESRQSIVRAKAEMQKPYGRQDELESAETSLARLEREIVLSPWPAPAWFRVGAPQGSLIYLREKGELVAYDIEAHRWDENDYWAMVMKDGDLLPIPYKELLDATGSRLFEDQEFTPPPAAPPVQADGNQGAFPGIEQGLDSEFGSRILIDRQTGERAASPKFQTPYMIVPTGFYDRPSDNTPQRTTERLAGTIIEDRQPTAEMLLDVPRRARGMARRRAQLRRIIANLERRLDDPEVQAGRSFHFGKTQERLDEVTKELEIAEALMMSYPNEPLQSAPRVVSSSLAPSRFMEEVESFRTGVTVEDGNPDPLQSERQASGVQGGVVSTQAQTPSLQGEVSKTAQALAKTKAGKWLINSGVRDPRILAWAVSSLKFELERGLAHPSLKRFAPPIYSDHYQRNDEAYGKAARVGRGLFDQIYREAKETYKINPGVIDRILPTLPVVRDWLTLEDGSIILNAPVLESGYSGPLFSAPRLGIEDPDFAEALDYLNEQLPSETEREDLLNRAGFNWNRTYTDEELRQAATGVRFGLRSEYDERLDRQTHEGWNAEAVELLRNNRSGVIRDLVATAAAGEAIINPVQVKASQLLLPSLTMRALAAGDRQAMRDAEALTWAYDIAGTETARGLAARWQPHLTPEEIHRELIAKAIFTPSKADRDRAAKAPTPTGKRRRIAELEAEIERVKAEAQARERSLLEQVTGWTSEARQRLATLRRETSREIKTLREQLQNLQDQKDSLQILAEANDARLKKIEEAFKEMGVTFHDLFVSKEAVIALRTSSMVKNVLSQFNEKERLVTKMRMEAKTDRHIAKKLNISKTAVEAINERFNVAFRAQAREWVKRGFSAADLDGSVDLATLIDEKGNLLSAARPTLTDAEIDAKVDEIFRVIVPSEEARATGALKRRPEGAKEGEYEFDLSRPEHAAMLMRAIQRLDATGMDMVYEYWINGLLSGPATHMANFAGNAGNAAWEYSVQRPVEMLVNSIITRDAAGAQFSEVQSMAKYLGLAASTAARYARIVWKTEVSLFDPQWLNKPVSIGTTSGDKGQVQRFAIKGKKGQFIRIPSRALSFADEFAKHLFGMLEAAAQAHRLAKAEGLKGAEFDARVDRLVKTPGSPAWLAAVDKAHALTFTSELPAPLQKAQDILHDRAKTPWGAVLKTFLRFLFPFVRTPYNIFATGLRKTPLGGLRMIGKGIAAYRGNEPFFDSYPKAAMAADIAEQLLAWTATMMLIGIAEGDPDDDEKTLLITGSRSLADNRGEDQMLSRMKGGENTIVWKGKPIFHYGRYEPFSTVITTVVDAARNMKAMGQGRSTKEAFDQTWRGFLNQARSKTFLQGLEGLMSLIEGHKNLTDSAVKALAQGVVPNLIRQPLRAADDYARDSRNAPWYYQAFPAGGLAEPLYDLYGRPVQKAGGPISRALISVPTKQMPIVPADKAMAKFNLENPNDSYYPQQPNKSMFRYKVPVPGLDAKGKPKSEYKDMTPQEAAAFRKRAGQQFASAATMTFPFGAGTATPLQMEDIKAKRDRVQRETKEAMFPGRAPAMPPRKAPTLAELFGRRLRQ